VLRRLSDDPTTTSCCLAACSDIGGLFTQLDLPRSPCSPDAWCWSRRAWVAAPCEP